MHTPAAVESRIEMTWWIAIGAFISRNASWEDKSEILGSHEASLLIKAKKQRPES
jgi:hypothetical protein